MILGSRERFCYFTFAFCSDYGIFVFAVANVLVPVVRTLTL